MFPKYFICKINLSSKGFCNNGFLNIPWQAYFAKFLVSSSFYFFLFCGEFGQNVDLKDWNQCPEICREMNSRPYQVGRWTIATHHTLGTLSEKHEWTESRTKHLLIISTSLKNLSRTFFWQDQQTYCFHIQFSAKVQCNLSVTSTAEYLEEIINIKIARPTDSFLLCSFTGDRGIQMLLRQYSVPEVHLNLPQCIRVCSDVRV